MYKFYMDLYIDNIMNLKNQKKNHLCKKYKK